MDKSNISLPSPEKPLKERVCDYFKVLIKNGQLTPGSVLPPTRELASQLGVSRDTIVRAYEELERLKYIESSSTRGYFVCKDLPDSENSSSSKEVESEKPDQILLSRLSAYGRDIAQSIPAYPMSSDFSAFNYGGPSPELLPINRWRENLKAIAETLNESDYTPAILGRYELRKAIAAYLGRTKQIKCSPEQIVIFSSTYSAAILICRLLLNAGDLLAVEEPGYGGIRNIARSLNIDLLPLPVDEKGVKPDNLFRTRDQVKMIYLTSSHQEPTGATLSPERREQIISWASNCGAWIFEDDFDGYFFYGKHSPPPLKSYKNSDNIIYMATFWRLLYPLASLGFCLLPKALVSLLERTKLEVEGVAESIAQLSLAKMLDDGYLELYIRRLTKKYASRRTALITELNKQLGPEVEIAGQGSGTQLHVFIPNKSEAEILKAAEISCIPLISTSSHYMIKPEQSSYVIDFSCLSEEKLSELVASFVSELKNQK